MHLPAGDSFGGEPVAELPAALERTFAHPDAIAAIEDTLSGTLSTAESIVLEVDSTGRSVPRADQRIQGMPVDEVSPLCVSAAYADPAVRLAVMEVNLRAVRDLSEWVAARRDAGHDWVGPLDERARVGLLALRSWVARDSVDLGLNEMLDSFVGRSDGGKVAELRRLIREHGVPDPVADQVWRRFEQLAAADKAAFVEAFSAAPGVVPRGLSPDPQVSRLSEARVAQIFQQRIVRALFGDLAPVADPELVVAGGQTGAGKTTLLRKVKEMFAGRGGVAHIAGNILFKFHPAYEELAAGDDPDAIRHIVPEVMQWLRMAIDHARHGRYNVALEEAFDDPARVAETITRFAEHGYPTSLDILAVPSVVSRLSMIARFVRGNDVYMPPVVHDSGLAGTAQMLRLIGAGSPPSGIATIRIHARDHVLFEGTSTDAAFTETLVALERSRAWSAAEESGFRTELAAVEADLTRGAEAGIFDPATVETLRQELRDVAAAAEQWLVYPEASADAEHGGSQMSAAEPTDLRMLLFNDEWDPLHGGGLTVVNRRLAEGLVEAGHQVFVRVGHSVTGQEGGAITVLGPRHYDQKVDRRRQMTSDLDTFPERIDVVVAHSRHTGEAGRFLRTQLYPNAALVHVLHTDAAAYGLFSGDFEKGLSDEQIDRDLTATADVVVGVGPLLTRYGHWLAAGAHATAVVHELTPGFDVAEQIQCPAVDGPLNILVFGRINDERKRVGAAAQMVKLLNQRGLDVRLTVRGARPETVARSKQLLSAAADREVTVREHTQTPADIYDDMRNAHLVLMPSIAESFGMVVTETLSAGVPLLMPETSGAGRFLADEARFPAALSARMLVPQGYLAQVSVPVWADHIEAALSDLEGSWAAAAQIRAILLRDDISWRAAVQSLARVADRARRTRDGERS